MGNDMKFNVSSQASTHTNADLHRKSSTPDAAATDPDLDLAVVVMPTQPTRSTVTRCSTRYARSSGR
jgi:hypothetical protein